MPLPKTTTKQVLKKFAQLTSLYIDHTINMTLIIEKRSIFRYPYFLKTVILDPLTLPTLAKKQPFLLFFFLVARVYSVKFDWPLCHLGTISAHLYFTQIIIDLLNDINYTSQLKLIFY